MRLGKDFNRKEAISIIKKSINEMVSCCSKLTTLNNAFVLYDGVLVLDLKVLNPSWQSDRRPTVKGERINFIEFKKYFFLGHTFKTSLVKMSDEEICDVYNYFDHMIKLKK